MKYLGVDFGLKRVGLATSEGELASSWQVMKIKSLKDGLEKLTKIVEDANFDKVVVGMPEGKMGQIVGGFIKKLKSRGIDAVEADETLSSKQALKMMIEKRIRQKERRLVDAYAAAIILQNYLDENKL